MNGGDSARGALQRFRRNRKLAAGLVLVGVLYILALFAPILAPHPPDLPLDPVHNSNQPPSWDHPLGTDRSARDVTSRLLFGARISLSVGLAAVTISIVVGTLVGVLAGYRGGWVDEVLMRFVDLLISFPRLVLLLAVAVLFRDARVFQASPGLYLMLLMSLLGLTGWMQTARMIRAEVLSLREREFVVAADAIGAAPLRVVTRHLIPNCLAPLAVTAALGMGHAILAEAGLSFLGLGVPPPTASWGGMINDGRNLLLGAPWITVFPGLAIALAVFGFNLVGDGVQEAFDPRTGYRRDR